MHVGYAAPLGPVAPRRRRTRTARQLNFGVGQLRAYSFYTVMLLHSALIARGSLVPSVLLAGTVAVLGACKRDTVGGGEPRSAVGVQRASADTASPQQPDSVRAFAADLTAALWPKLGVNPNCLTPQYVEWLLRYTATIQKADQGIKAAAQMYGPLPSSWAGLSWTAFKMLRAYRTGGHDFGLALENTAILPVRPYVEEYMSDCSTDAPLFTRWRQPSPAEADSGVH